MSPKPIWLKFHHNGAMTATQASAEMIGDSIFEDGEFQEYTILKIIGGLRLFSGTLGSDEVLGFNILVAHGDAADADLPDPLPAANTHIFDMESNPMWTYLDMFSANEDTTVRDQVPIDINTRRVVRNPEALHFNHQATSSGQEYFLWARMLILPSG